jgi:HPt (histidine-containing phosphotransfer) domain-containing protein
MSRGDARREIIQGRIRHNLHVPGFNATELFEEYGDHGLVRELAQLLVDTTPSQLDAIRSAVAASDAMALRAAAHRLRGSIVAFGVPDAVETARALEAMGSAGDLTGAEALSTSLAGDVQSLRESAQAWLTSDAQSANR